MNDTSKKEIAKNMVESFIRHALLNFDFLTKYNHDEIEILLCNYIKGELKDLIKVELELEKNKHNENEDETKISLFFEDMILDFFVSTDMEERKED
jgi:hypothetical protein